MSEVENSKILRAASFRLAQKILAFAGLKEPTAAQVKHAAKLIEGHAKNYGNRRVARLRKEGKAE